MAKSVSRFIYWTPRIMSIIFIIFLFLMSLDVISPDLSLGQIMIGMFMHNIPVLILLVVVLISWKFEILGAVVFILAGLLYMIFVITSDAAWYLALSWSLTIAAPAFLIGILFLINWYKKKK